MTPPAAVSSTRTAIGCAVLFLLPFAAVGVFAAVQLMAAIGRRDWPQAGFLLVFVLTFGGVGVGGIATVLAGRRRAEEGLAREARHPEAPWLWREDWAARRIGDSSRGAMWGAWIFTALWNLISIPSAVMAVRAALREGNHLAWIALLFPIVGVGLLVWAVRATARYRRYGVSTFELSHAAGRARALARGVGADAARAAPSRWISGDVELHPAGDAGQRQEPVDLGEHALAGGAAGAGDGRRRADRLSHPRRRHAERPGARGRPGVLAIGRHGGRPRRGLRRELRGAGVPHRREPSSPERRRS